MALQTNMRTKVFQNRQKSSFVINQEVADYIYNDLATLVANDQYLLSLINALVPDTNAIGIVASIVQTQVGGTPLTATNNWIDTTAHANDAVTIAVTGDTCGAINLGANTLQIFPPSGTNLTIDGTPLSANASTTIAPGNQLFFKQTSPTEWRNI